MKSISRTIFILCFSFLFTGCFEITEEVNLEPDGSGDFVITINMSESKTQVAAHLGKTTSDGVEVPSRTQLERGLSQLEHMLENVEAIGKVQTAGDFDTYIFKVSGHFTNINGLNKAIRLVAGEMGESFPPVFRDISFSYTGRQFARYFDYTMDRGDYYKLSYTQRKILESAQMVSIYRFKKNISDFTNRSARLSPSKRAVMLIHPVADIVLGKATLANRVWLE